MPSTTSDATRTGGTRSSLLELGLLFLKLGSTAIGGPAVHIGMMEEDIVTRRHWLTRGEFLDFLGAANLIPGPTSTEKAIHVGRVRAGWRGLLVAGVSFILPAALMVGCLAWAYVRYGALPQVGTVLNAVKPVVIIVIAQGAFRLGRSAVKSIWLAVLGAAAMAAVALGLDPLLTLGAAGGVAGLLHGGSERGRRNLVAGSLATASGAAIAKAVPFSLTLLSLVMLKIGATMFGGGYILVAFLRSDLVVRLGWLTERPLLDAVAIGQVTPGPLFTTATFIGYILGGVAGAVLATVAIFLPAFVLVAFSGPLVPRPAQFSYCGRRARWHQRGGIGVDGGGLSPAWSHCHRGRVHPDRRAPQRSASVSLSREFGMACGGQRGGGRVALAAGCASSLNTTGTT
jgi:chromate transporter